MINIKAIPNKLYKELGKLFRNLRKALIAAFVAYLISTSGTLWLRNVLQKPIPLWLVIVFLLSIFFGCAILCLIHSYKKTPKVKNELIEAEGFKWETIFQNNIIHKVSKIPFCKIHDLRLTKFKDTYNCTEKDCNTSIETNILPKVYEIAFNHIELIIRKMQ